MAENNSVLGYNNCDSQMQGRHEAELKTLKEGQDRMEGSLKDLTVAIKEYVALTQELQTTRIDTLEKRQEQYETIVEQINKDVVKIAGKTDFTYKVVMAAAGVLIVGLVGVVFGLIWANTTQHIQPEKVTSWITYYIC